VHSTQCAAGFWSSTRTKSSAYGPIYALQGIFQSRKRAGK
jgi:hypothetical protein